MRGDRSVSKKQGGNVGIGKLHCGKPIGGGKKGGHLEMSKHRGERSTGGRGTKGYHVPEAGLEVERKRKHVRRKTKGQRGPWV